MLAGALAVPGFAPYGLFALPVLSLALLFWLWLRAARPAQAAWLGWLFGMGLFVSGVSWLYLALHEYGGMPAWLAWLALLLFAALISVPAALAGYWQAQWSAPLPLRSLLVLPALWTLAEWLRGLMFGGFPWLVFGYAQTPPSPLAGYAPLLGVYGVSLGVAVSAGLLLQTWQARGSRAGRAAWVGLFGIWLLGAALGRVHWTQPQGEPLKVALLQGNIAQELKFSEAALVDTLETYRRLAEGSDARLIILPETALPLLREQVPPAYHARLADHARQHGSDILIGAFEQEDGRYYNSVYTLGSAASQHYRKDHLVPFGEFIPLRNVFGWLINDVLHIPMSDLARGGPQQPPLAVAGQRVAVNICYEDAFGEEIIRALPDASLLVNVSNDAWYGDSIAAAQHNQLSQLRALESGRMVLRATNTGVTSVISVDGRVLAQLPQHQPGVLTATVQGYLGATPYVLWGNVAALALVLALLAVAWRRRAP
ncbi:MAG: apolipoprotein N-acyltransferase [Sideroxydans sp.]